MPPIPFKLILAQRTTELPNIALSIVNPVQNADGIYQVTDSDGNTFSAYVDMTTDGGYWVLAARWVGNVATANQRTFLNLVVRDQPINGYSVNPSTHPAIPAGRIIQNPALQYSLRSSNSSWTSLFGTWQRMSTFENASQSILHGVGVPAVTSIGNRTLHGHRTGWGGNTDLSCVLGFWTVSGNGGHCGGAGIVGPNKCCPVISNEDSGSHYDSSAAIKQVYLRASNYPG